MQFATRLALDSRVVILHLIGWLLVSRVMVVSIDKVQNIEVVAVVLFDLQIPI